MSVLLAFISLLSSFSFDAALIVTIMWFGKDMLLNSETISFQSPEALPA
jgi:hypothetical protein